MMINPPIRYLDTVWEFRHRINSYTQLLNDLDQTYRASWKRLTTAIYDGVVPPIDLSMHYDYVYSFFTRCKALLQDIVVILDLLEGNDIKDDTSSIEKNIIGLIDKLKELNCIHTSYINTQDFRHCLMAPEEILEKWVNGVLNEYINPELEHTLLGLEEECIHLKTLIYEVADASNKYVEIIKETKTLRTS